MASVEVVKPVFIKITNLLVKIFFIKFESIGGIEAKSESLFWSKECVWFRIRFDRWTWEVCNFIIINIVANITNIIAIIIIRPWNLQVFNNYINIT